MKSHRGKDLSVGLYRKMRLNCDAEKSGVGEKLDALWAGVDQEEHQPGVTLGIVLEQGLNICGSLCLLTCRGKSHGC